MKSKHPSGRPIRKPNRRGYSMIAHRSTEFVCPRLNDIKIKRITAATDLHAIGFIDWRAGDVPDYENTARRGKR